jgi:hypothetical protein
MSFQHFAGIMYQWEMDEPVNGSKTNHSMVQVLKYQKRKKIERTNLFVLEHHIPGENNR